MTGPARRPAAFSFGLKLSLCLPVVFAVTAALHICVASASSRLNLRITGMTAVSSEIAEWESESVGLCGQVFEEEGFSCDEHQACISWCCPGS